MEQQWQDLKCDVCQSDQIIPLVKLRWKDKSGLTTTPNGYKCGGCNRHIVVDRLIKDVQIRLKDQEIQELIDQKQQMAPAPEPSNDKNKSPSFQGRDRETKAAS